MVFMLPIPYFQSLLPRDWKTAHELLWVSMDQIFYLVTQEWALKVFITRCLLLDQSPIPTPKSPPCCLKGHHRPSPQKKCFRNVRRSTFEIISHRLSTHTCVFWGGPKRPPRFDISCVGTHWIGNLPTISIFDSNFFFFFNYLENVEKSLNAQPADTMYTNLANLQQTMLLQQKLFRQALMQSTDNKHFTAPNLSQYQFVSSQQVRI